MSLIETFASSRSAAIASSASWYARAIASRLLGPRHVLAEDVDGGADARGVELRDDPARVVERLAGDVGRRDPADDGPRHGGEDADDGAVEHPHGDGDPIRA